MKMPKPIFFLVLLCVQLTATAQLQWYQNQDGNNPPPYGTVATTIQPFTTNTFIACYLWSSDAEQNTWKISKSNTNGAEQKTFFLTGISSTVECKVGKSNTVYVFERSFTADWTPLYKVYKLDANLNVQATRNIEFPNGFFIYNIGAFELDGQGNVYFAGDGQYPNAGGSYSPASFVLKTNKNLVDTWKRMDSTETSFSRLLIDRTGRVLVVQDYYAFFPEVRIKRYSNTGQVMTPFTVQTDIDRYSLYSTLDDDDNILLYGGKMIGETAQAIYVKRVSRFNGNVAYSKTYFTAPSTQLNDFRVDDRGNIFTLVTQYYSPDNQQSRISKINLSNGTIAWNRTMNFSQDSCNLTKLVMGDDDRFFAIGERRSCSYFSKGFAMRIKKNGNIDGDYPAPDSVAFQRLHYLSDGMIDQNDQLIAIGNTSDFDTMTYSNSYFRSFAVRFGNNGGHGCYNKGEAEMLAETTEEDPVPQQMRLNVYPNPVQNELTVAHINPEEYNRLVIVNVLGVRLQQQVITTEMARVNIMNLADGVYFLVLQSPKGLKDKTIRFVVKK